MGKCKTISFWTPRVNKWKTNFRLCHWSSSIFFSPNYLAIFDDQNGKYDYTGFDYQHYSIGISAIETSSVDCEDARYSQYCQANDSFYNPKKEPIISQRNLADYQLITEPHHACERGKAILPWIIYRENYSEYKCNGYEAFDIKINANNQDITVTCIKQNAGKENYYEQVYFDEQGNQVVLDRHFICPDPERFCRTMKLSSEDTGNPWKVAEK